MDRHAEWVKAQHELSEASKNVHFWKAMPADVRTRIGTKQYREECADARHRFKEADRLCRDASLAKRIASCLENKGAERAA